MYCKKISVQGQEDFSSGQEAFHTHLGMGYRSDKLSVNCII